MPNLAKHLTPWDFFCFLEGQMDGHTDSQLESHLTQCRECLEMLDLILMAARGGGTIHGQGGALGLEGKLRYPEHDADGSTPIGGVHCQVNNSADWNIV